MPRTGFSFPSLRVSTSWKYALVGGIASIPFTVWLYWQSTPENEFSLTAVFFGGLLTGYLASATPAEMDTAGVGFRAGIIGAVPVLWILVDFLNAATVLSGPLWFRVVAISMVVLIITSVVIGVGGLFGLFGAKVGGWLAKKTGAQRIPSVGD